jgi:putative transposase
MPEENRDSRSHLRLAPEVYGRTDLVCAISIRTRQHWALFGDATYAKAAVEVLGAFASENHVSVYGYCVMPDHVHLVLSASSDCDVITFVARYKNLVQRSLWDLGVHGLVWQRRFWDRFLRREDDIRIAVEYVLANPVRAGLVEAWAAYPYSGSLVWPLR